jgi:hypothetical protein
VSYTQADAAWAEWISWQLEAGGFRVLVQAWDAVPGSHWSAVMQDGVLHAERTVAVVSRAYLASVFGAAEWNAAWRADPRGAGRKLIPVRVEDCPQPGLLGDVVSFDLFDLTEDAARSMLLRRIDAARLGRAKPGVAPAFPGMRALAAPASSTPPEFPGGIGRRAGSSASPERDVVVDGRWAADGHAERVQPIRRSASESAADPANRPPGGVAPGERPPPARFRGLIAEKTRDFVGREHVFEEIDTWMAANPNGYFTIRGDPGVGKSAIIARHALRTPCVVYFNQRACGLTQAGQFLDSMRRQLAEWFAPPIGGPLSAATGGWMLSEALDELAPRLAGTRLVIAVDALDEVDMSTQERGTNILYLPPCPPDGVFFLLTQRRIPLPLVVDAPAHTLDLADPRFRARNRADAEAYLARSAEIPAVRDWASRQGLTRAAYVDHLVEKSDANFMYLRHVVADIAAGRLRGRSANGLPEGLQQYYANHWTLMGMDSSPIPRTKLEVLYVLLEYQEPISVPLLAEIIRKPATAVVEVVREWGQFLRGEGTGAQAVYSLYHESFADFLRQNEVLAASGVDLAEINACIARRLFAEDAARMAP